MRHRAIDIDGNLFLIALAVVRLNWMPYTVATLLLLAANASDGFLAAPLAFAVVRALILMIVGYSAYRCLLSGGAVCGWQAVAERGRIPWRYAGVMLIILSPIMVLGIMWIEPGKGASPDTLGQIGVGLALVVVYAALYVLLGTALPAVVERREAALSEAFARGRRHYRAIGRSLVVGVWLFRAASMLALIGMNLAGVTTDFFDGLGGPFQAAALGPMLLFNCSHVFAECLNATVLLRAYRRYPVEPDGARVI
jgi:hypothetical protein